MWQTRGGESDLKAEADQRGAATSTGMPGEPPERKEARNKSPPPHQSLQTACEPAETWS